MSKNLKTLLIVGAIIAAIICTLIIYSVNQVPSVIPKPGRYSSSDGALNVSAMSDYAGNFVLEQESRCIVDSCGTLVKSYTVEHSLFYGDILVIDWLRDKKLKFKVDSETKLSVLADCGIFEKGQVFTLQEET